MTGGVLVKVVSCGSEEVPPERIRCRGGAVRWYHHLHPSLGQVEVDWLFPMNHWR